MKLTDLEAEFVRVVEPGKSTMRVATLAEAQGVRFVCPLCGAHSVLAWFADRNVPLDESPGPGRWTPTGMGLEDLTLHPSVHLSGGGCGWHGFVTNGSAA